MTFFVNVMVETEDARGNIYADSAKDMMWRSFEYHKVGKAILAAPRIIRFVKEYLQEAVEEGKYSHARATDVEVYSYDGPNQNKVVHYSVDCRR